MIFHDTQVRGSLEPRRRAYKDERAMQKADYTAIDPAAQLFVCRCGKPTCQMLRLRPFREHIKRLFQAISVAEHLGLLASKDPEVDWDAVLFPLQMAASLEDASANTAYVDDSDSIFYCGTAWEFEKLSSEIAAKYVAGLTIFNFLWFAYEAAVSAAGGGRFKRDKVAVQGRRLAQENPRPDDEFPFVKVLYRLAERCCRICGDLDSQIDPIAKEYGLSGLAAAADLARIYRNHLAHGDDAVPTGAWDWNENGKGKANFVIFRMYAVSRLLLLLIQEFAFLSLTDPAVRMPLTLFEDDDEPTRNGPETFLHLHVLTSEELAERG